MAPEAPRGLTLGLLEAVPAAATALRIVIDDLVELILGGELAPRPAVPGLATRLARRALGPLAGLCAALLAGLRRIGGRWLGAVSRALPDLLFKPLDPRLEAGDPALVARRQLDHELDARLAAGVVDGLRLGALHAPRFDATPRSPGLCQPWP